jgi:prepilin-type N-terminal cleavage/methylation domain-containing protein
VTRRLRQQRDEGFSLVEMLVTLVLLGVVSGLVMTMVIQASKTAARQNDQTYTLTAAKVALERITRDIRGANSLTTTDPREVAFVTRTTTTRKATRVYVRTTGTATELLQRDTTTDINTGAAISDSTKVIVGGMQVGQSDAVFTYYAGDYYGEGDTRTVALSPATPASTRTIGVRVRLYRKYSAPPFDLYQVVSIRNLEA